MSGPAENGESLPAFGRWLARERELRGLGRDDVARAMKLAPGVVEALESGEEERMPPRAYAVGYLRAYAAAVGLDPDEAVLRFEEAAGPPHGDKRSAAAPPRGGARPAVAPPRGGARPAVAPPRGGARPSRPAAIQGRAVAIAIAVAVALAGAAAWALLR